MGDAAGMVTVISQNHHEKLIGGLWNCLLSNYGVDMDVQWGGRSIRAHRLVLDVFLSPEKLNQRADQLSWHCQQQQTNASLDALLEFLYRGQVTLPREQLANLLEAARASDFHMLVEAVDQAASVKPEMKCGLVARANPASVARAPRYGGAPEVAYTVAGGSVEQWSYGGVGGADTDREQFAATGAVQVPAVAANTTPPGGQPTKRTVKRTVGAKSGTGSAAGAKLVKPFKCDICQLQCATRQNLTIHSRVHTGERPYSCPQCPKAFARSDRLKKHILTHVGTKPYKCDLCDKSFAQRPNLVIHARKHTGEKPYKCDVCKKTFVQRPNLYVHLRTHTGERPYKCTSCVKSFTRRINLIRHQLVHENKKPMKCDVCKKSFRLKGDLKNHQKVHGHKNAPVDKTSVPTAVDTSITVTTTTTTTAAKTTPVTLASVIVTEVVSLASAAASAPAAT